MSVRIAVFGLGYLGATHALCMAELGHHVVGVDVDMKKIDMLRSGELPFYEPGLGELLQRNLAAGRLRFTTSYSEAAQFAQVHFIAVGTPQRSDSLAADLSHVDAVIESLAPLLTKPAVLFGKSTVPVGTAKRLAARVRELAPAGETVELAWNPEFLREGFAVHDTLKPDRLVLGVDSAHPSRAETVAREVFAPLLDDGVPFLVTDFATSELVKVAANAFLATKISFINAMAEVCDHTAGDVSMLAEALGYDPRIGREFLRAGVGFGGGCLPKDIRAFSARADELGAKGASAILMAVDDINTRSRSHAIDVTREVCGSLPGARVAVLGAAFKPDSDDVRDSPALDIANQLQRHGADVVVYDPMAMGNARLQFPGLSYASTLGDACEGADAVLVLTEWAEFRKLHPRDLDTVVRCKVLVDGRNCLDPAPWQKAGWTYRGIGRPELTVTEIGVPARVSDREFAVGA
ncbi:UDP-glucose dehydrogenase family protein [Rhodococcus sp. OK302]|uniref:UDP-glucose dehydrogenase family protein n=1 Tax=Rhodococcus sp. OK302 TaxID=1882769 RepID=UPI000B941BB6|nr:UDP-glucose/GDP-mannose dehydrogenase family protein [Rhodococcus sp. OK302]OYD69867.1 UDPglucose 6-dehydrogenase [Rhodococcus sp. OK302]